jgi:hypothetical protein
MTHAPYHGKQTLGQMFSIDACSDGFPVEHMGTTHKLSSTAM